MDTNKKLVFYCWKDKSIRTSSLLPTCRNASLLSFWFFFLFFAPFSSLLLPFCFSLRRFTNEEHRTIQLSLLLTPLDDDNNLCRHHPSSPSSLLPPPSTPSAASHPPSPSATAPLPPSAAWSPSSKHIEFKLAKQLYDHGLYPQSQTLFSCRGNI